MELMKISDTALKVSLTREDMEYYDIEFDKLDYSSIETRRIIWSILDEAKRTLGFNAVRDSLYIQAFRSRCGGCELFVSGEEKKPMKKKALYRFENADTVIKICVRLENCNFDGESSLFVGDDGKFYLVLCVIDKKDMFLDEVGEHLDYSEGYIAEHTSFVCDNAVKTMAELK